MSAYNADWTPYQPVEALYTGFCDFYSSYIVGALKVGCWRIGGGQQYPAEAFSKITGSPAEAFTKV